MDDKAGSILDDPFVDMTGQKPPTMPDPMEEDMMEIPFDEYMSKLAEVKLELAGRIDSPCSMRAYKNLFVENSMSRMYLKRASKDGVDTTTTVKKLLTLFEDE